MSSAPTRTRTCGNNWVTTKPRAASKLALRFFGAVEEAIHLLYRYPDAGTPKEFANPRLKGLRSWPVPGFENIRLYYVRPDETTIRILRVLRGKRDLERMLERELE